ncbi:MAG: hypothetical protein NXH72_08245 [Hyphomonadaceae bacterium]|nr:hypothetical protein [Hyphomonadaceae bacterium]
MLETIRNFGQDGAVLLMGIAVGAAWIVAIVAPNTSYDHLNDDEAEDHVRELLKSASDPIAVLLLVAAGLAILGSALIAGISALIAAFGFFTNRWTLAGIKAKDGKTDHQKPGKTQRILAVSLTLIFSLVAAAGAGLAVFGL